MEEKHLGKIDSVKFGYVGYQDMQFGLQITFYFQGYGLSTTIANSWSLDMKCTKDCNWTEEDREKGFGKTMKEINKLMQDAKVQDVTKLKGVPVEVVLENDRFKSFRVLTEVL